MKRALTVMLLGLLAVSSGCGASTPAVVAVQAPRVVPSLKTDIRITRQVPCGASKRVSPADVSRFRAVTAVMCASGQRVYAGSGRWQVIVRKVAVSRVSALQAYFEQSSDLTVPKNAICTTNLEVVLTPAFVDSKGHWLVPTTPVDGCGHPLGLPAGLKPSRVRWRVVSVRKIRLMVTAPALAAGCDMGMGRPVAHSWTSTPFGGAQPWKVRVCVYRTSARHQWVGNFVRGLRLDHSQTKRLLPALTLKGSNRGCTRVPEFAEVFGRQPGSTVGLELGGCYRVNGGPGRADRAVVRSILGARR
jgi:hypothetical protein